MKNIIDIYEGIFDKQNSSKVGTSIEDSFNIPTPKDFVRNEYNNKMVGVVWDCGWILDQYRGKYPELLQDWDSMQFQLDLSYRVVDVTVFFCKKSEMRGFVGNKKYIPGWTEGFTGSNLVTYKKMIIRIIETLAKDNSKMEMFLKQADYARKEIGKDNTNYGLKELYNLTHK